MKFEYVGTRGSFTARQAQTGWVVEITSRNQGQMTDQRFLVPYSDRWPKDEDLNKENNYETTSLQILATEAEELGRCIRRGYRVE